MSRAFWRQLSDHAILLSGVALMTGPLAYLIYLSLSGGDAPLDAYSRLWSLRLGFKDTVSVASMLQLSLLVALAFGVLKTVLAMAAAYALVFFRVCGATMIFFLILLTLYLPLQARPVQTYLISLELGFLNQPAGLVVPLLASGLGVFLFRQFYLQIPPELVEAARIDGAGAMRFFAQCILPISGPFMAALFAIHFIEGWRQYMWPGLIASDERFSTLMRGIAMVSPGSPTGLALAVVAILPPLALIIVLGPLIAKSMNFDSALD